MRQTPPRRRPPSSRRRPRYNLVPTEAIHGYNVWTDELDNEHLENKHLRLDLERLRLENEHLRWENEQLPPRVSASIMNLLSGCVTLQNAP